MELEVAKSLAIRAGEILLQHYDRPNVSWKEHDNPVTEADRQASAFLVEELKRMFPEDGILSEEELDDTSRLSKSRVWIIDPLDGTKEFISHVAEFAVMIGLSIEGSAGLGVVYQPITQKLYYANRGSGAFLTESGTTRQLHVSRDTDPHAMTIALSRSHPSAMVDMIQGELGIARTVTSGSMGLKVGLICEGRAHVYLNTGRGTSQWDTCAPDVILHEAGGRMTDLLGIALRYNGRELRNLRGVIASNGTIHERIVKTAQSAIAQTQR